MDQYEPELSEEDIEDIQEEIKKSGNYSDATKLMVEQSRDVRDARFKLEEVRTSFYSSLSVIGLTFVLTGIESYRFFHLQPLKYASLGMLALGFIMTLFSFYRLVSTYLVFRSRITEFIKEAMKQNVIIRKSKKMLEKAGYELDL